MTKSTGVGRGKGGGRPRTPFKDEYIGFAKNLASKFGLTEWEIGQAIGVSVDTMRKWKIEHPKFDRALKIGKKPANDRVTASLYHRAIGYTWNSEQIVPYDEVRTLLDADGKPRETVKTKKVLRVPIVEHMPPDPKSALGWLFNREPTLWRQRMQISTPPGEPFEVADKTIPTEPELIGEYYARLRSQQAGATPPRTDPGAPQGVGPAGPAQATQKTP